MSLVKLANKYRISIDTIKKYHDEDTLKKYQNMFDDLTSIDKNKPSVEDYSELIKSRNIGKKHRQIKLDKLKKIKLKHGLIGAGLGLAALGTGIYLHHNKNKETN